MLQTHGMSTEHTMSSYDDRLVQEVLAEAARRRWTRKHLIIEAGIDTVRGYGILSGKIRARVDELAALGRALGLTIGDLDARAKQSAMQVSA